MKTSTILLSSLAAWAGAAPTEFNYAAALGIDTPAGSPTEDLLKRQLPGSPTVIIPSPDATIVGINVGAVDSFQGIQFAQHPVGDRRFRPPQPLPLDQSLGTINAVLMGAACPQNLVTTDFANNLPQAALGVLINTPLFQEVGILDEACMHINVYRPAGIDANAKLPVLFWMHGGGFTMGFTMPGEGIPFVADSITQGKPIIFVAVEYRMGGFGFLAGKEVQEAGVGNLGLLDQRQGMRWVADNIAAFGGDPDKVTIWGESAGAISVFDHLILYDGDNTYNGKPLFRGGIMNSGSLIPAEPLDCPKAQRVYDHIVEKAECAGAADTLQCLREQDYYKVLFATTDLPTFTGYDSIALTYMPRPDGIAMTKSPEFLIKEGKFARVPIIVGNEEDEGTLWSLMQPNITTTDQVAEYLLEKFFWQNANIQDTQELVATYQTITEDGSPYRTGLLNNWYPQYKRLAAILGDLAFTLSRRYFLEERKKVAPELKAWSYRSSYFYGVPILGSVHGGDIFKIVWGVPYDYATRTMRGYYYSFIHQQDPNWNNASPNWPTWESSNLLMNLFTASQTLIPDDFRWDSYDWIRNHVPELTM